MANTIGTAYVQIEPTTTGIESKLTNEFEKGGKKASSAFGSAFKGATATLGAIGVGASALGKSLWDSANSTAEMGDQIDKMSQKLGVSAQTYQEYDYVMQLAGTSMADMGTGLKTLTNQIGNATNGSKESAEMFAQLGISMDELGNMSREDVFKATITGLQGMEDSTERAALANKLFGKSGQNLTPLFNMTAEETEKLIGNFNEMGAVMSDEAVKDSAEFEDALTTLNKAFGGVKNGIMSQVLPSFTSFLNGLTGVITGQEGAKDQLMEGVEGLTNTLTEALPSVVESMSGLVEIIATIAPEILTSLGTGLINALPSLIPILIDLVLQIGTALIDMLPTLITNITDALVTGLPMIIEKLPEIITSITLGLIENLPILLEGILQIIVAVGVALIEAIPKLLEAVPVILTSLKDKFIEMVTLLQTVGPEMIDTIKKAINDSWNKITGMVSDLVRQIKDKFHEKLEDFKGIGTYIIDGIKSGITNAWNNLTSWLEGLCGDLVNIVKNALGIASPSRVFAKEVGQWIPQGIAMGIQNGMGVLDDTMEEMASSMVENPHINATVSGAYVDGEYMGSYGGAYNQTVNIYSPTELNPSEVARQTKIATREMILQLRTD